MRRVINSTYMSVDGVVQEPERWTFDFRSPDAAQYSHDLLFSIDTVLMGRRTYESFAAVWPTFDDATGMADRMNALPKHVASDTLTAPEWNNTTVTKVAEFTELVRDLKQGQGQDIVQYGFGPMTRALIREELLDELQIWLHPIFVGNVRPASAISHETDAARFRLSDVRRFDSGVVLLEYQLR